MSRKRADHGLAVRCAREFHERISGLLREVPADHDRPPFETEGVQVFLATNLTFATELLLKAAVAVATGAHPHGHNLIEIFKQLPKEEREELQQRFSAEFSKRAEPRELRVTLSPKSVPVEVIEAKEAEYDNSMPEGAFDSLERILISTGESYTAWRYLHEILDSNDGVRIVPLHWEHLDCLCQVLLRKFEE